MFNTRRDYLANWLTRYAVHLFVNNIKPVNWNKEAFEKLVLPPRMKNTVHALVTARKLATTAELSAVPDKRKKRDDIIRNKGKGLIMLLHGGPGTGKTLTAESVAELAELPLYSVTCGCGMWYVMSTGLNSAIMR